ncbi:MAG: hypothetical protein R6U44_08845 [Archaeoglobaceae archaeon]
MKSRDNKIIADSSFYICYLDDINEPDTLLETMMTLEFVVTPIVETEIKKSHSYKIIRERYLMWSETYNFGEILRPFFNVEEINRGEHEVVGLAYKFYSFGEKFYFIIDDGEVRELVENNNKVLSGYMIGTAKFTGMCYCIFQIFTKTRVLELLKKIENSKFRIKKKYIDAVRQYIGGC